MPRGCCPYDEARLQGRLWTPALITSAGVLGAYSTSEPHTISAPSGVSAYRCLVGKCAALEQATPGARPAYDPVARTITFDGVDDILSGSQGSLLSGNQAAWIAHFGAFHDVAVAAADHVGGINTGTSTSGQSMSMTGAYSASDGVITARLFNGGVSSQTSQTAGQEFGFLAQYRGTTHADTQIWRDGTLTSAFANNPANVMAFTGTTIFRLGATMNSGVISGFCRWRHRAMLIGHGILSTHDVNSIFGWWAWEFGFRHLLPASHPFRNRPPLIGD